ncbi:MAG: TonB-dependent receptor [Pseudomonadota bacterium]|nr:TonB-dependent receptor [Pseudomonadota bacterium]
MSLLRHAIRCQLALALPLFAAGLVQAQDSGDLEEVIVTGRAGVEEIRRVDVSYAVTTIGGEALRMDAPLGVADALGSVPGFWVEASGGEASANIRVRGIPEEGFSSVGMQEDGLPVQHDPGLGWLNADQSFRLDDTIDRIEVVRGGPASMFSSNSPGGVVNFITRKPRNVAGGHLKVESSDYGLRRVDGWYSLPVGDWRLGFGGFYREDDGVRDPGYTANEGGQARFAIGRSFEGGSVDFNVKRIDDKVIFYTGLPLTYDSDGEVVGVPGVDEHFGTLSGPDTRRVTLRNADGTFPLDIDRGTDVELTQYTLKFEYQLPGDWQLRNGTRYRESDSSRIGLFPNSVVTGQARLDSVRAGILATVPGATDVQLRYVNAPDQVFDVVAQNGNGLITDGSLRQVRVPLEELLNDLRLMRNFQIAGQQHDFAVGLYMAQADEEFQRYSANSLIDIRDNARLLNLVAVDAAGNPLASVTENGITRYGSEFANGAGESLTKALYFSDEWRLNEQWRIDLGARYEQVDVEGSVERSAGRNLGRAGIADDNILTGTGVFDRFDTDFDDFGWSAGVNWQFLDSMGVFARYTSTFRLPSVGDYITNANAIPVSRTMDFIEAGYKYQAERWSLYATLFQTNYDSFRFGDRVFNSMTGNYDEVNVLTDTETLGVELEGSITASQWLDIGFSATWQDPRFGDFVQTQLVNGQPQTFDFTDNRLLRVPEVSYRVTPAIRLHDAVRLELDYQYFGDRFADAANVLKLPSYAVFSANLRWSPMQRMTVYVRGENLLNEVGLTEGNPRAGTFISGEANSPFFIARPIYGRNFRFSLLWDF